MNTCKQCNKEFISLRKGTKFCGRHCNNKFLYLCEKAKNNYNRTCLNCSFDFISKRKNVKYCSEKCNKAHLLKLYPYRHAAKEAKRRAIKLKATPKWLTKDQLLQIEIIYKNRPNGFDVDHIVPLQGKEVKGLHVPWNLQYLKSSINCSKSNKVEI